MKCLDTSQFVFRFTQYIAICSFVCSAGEYTIEPEFKELAKKHKKLVKKEFDVGYSLIYQFPGFISKHERIIEEIYGPLLIKDLIKLSDTIKLFPQNNPRKLINLSPLYTEIVRKHFPQHDEVVMNLQRADKLLTELKNCTAGKKDWKKYEDICVRILSFLFVPPFKKIHTQVRTTDGYERRDAIMPNNMYNGFWKRINEEFESKNIICEFKNISSTNTKEDLNQLRIYLSKPTIGRFGLLFVRNEPSDVLKKAQRQAYEQSRIMVLILNDEIIELLIRAKAFIGSCEEVLESEKTKFEVNY